MFTEYSQIKVYLEERGYTVKDPWDVVQIFEERVAAYAGSKYAVSVDNCTNALFLCLKYLNATGEIEIPKNTYISVPQTIIHAGCKPKFVDMEWSGAYKLHPYNIVDGATRFTKGMYVQDSYHCLSFHAKKTLNISKGGMILTNDYESVKWFKKARYEGRDTSILYSEDKLGFLGWNMYMPPEQAAVGILKFDKLPEINPDCGGNLKYHDISNLEIWRNS